MRARQGAAQWRMTHLPAVFVLADVLVAMGVYVITLIVGLFGAIAGVALNDAGRLRIEVEQWRRAYGRLPPGDDD